jgi:hypothetical protein
MSDVILSVLQEDFVCRILRPLVIGPQHERVLSQYAGLAPEDTLDSLNRIKKYGILHHDPVTNTWELLADDQTRTIIYDALFAFELRVLAGRTLPNYHAQQRIQIIDELATAISHARSSYQNP